MVGMSVMVNMMFLINVMNLPPLICCWSVLTTTYLAIFGALEDYVSCFLNCD